MKDSESEFVSIIASGDQNARPKSIPLRFLVARGRVYAAGGSIGDDLTRKGVCQAISEELRRQGRLNTDAEHLTLEEVFQTAEAVPCYRVALSKSGAMKDVFPARLRKQYGPVVGRA